MDLQSFMCLSWCHDLPGLRLEGLFRVNGSVRTVDNLRQRFDGGEEVDLHQDADAFAVASLLKQFLRDLPEGLIHPSIHNPLIQLYQGESASVFIHGRCGVELKHLGCC